LNRCEITASVDRERTMNDAAQRSDGAHRALLVLVLAIGVGVRVAAFGAVPSGLNQDEAAIGYDAFALLHHGTDRNGYTNPVHLVSWGSGQNALYAYLSMPFIAAFGLHPSAVRAVNLIGGVLSLGLCYALARRLWNPTTALVATAVLAINPWHVMMSRWALESNLLPVLLLTTVWLLVRAFDRPRSLLAAAAAGAVSLYAYASAWLVVPIIFGLSTAYLWWHRRVSTRLASASTVIFLVLALPIAAFVMINLFELPEVRTAWLSVPRLPLRPRFAAITTFFRSEDVPGLASRISHLATLFVRQDDRNMLNTIPNAGVLYPFGSILAVVGVAVVLRQVSLRRASPSFVIAAWFAASVVLALGYARPNINQLNAAIPSLILATAAGMTATMRRVRSRSGTAAAVVIGILAALYMTSFVRFVHDYFTSYRRAASVVFHDGFVDAARFAARTPAGTICVTNAVKMPYVSVLFATAADPRVFRATARHTGASENFQRVSSFDRYVFGLEHCPDAARATVIVDASELDARASIAGRTVEAFGRYRVAVAP
jgi:hypothetical protein